MDFFSKNIIDSFMEKLANPAVMGMLVRQGQRAAAREIAPAMGGWGRRVLNKPIKPAIMPTPTPAPAPVASAPAATTPKKPRFVGAVVDPAVSAIERGPGVSAASKYLKRDKWYHKTGKAVLGATALGGLAVAGGASAAFASNPYESTPINY